MKNTRLIIYLSLLAVLSSIDCKAQSLLWKIEKNDQVSYLFGTIHIKDKRVFSFNDSLFKNLEKVDKLALEMDLSPSTLFKAQSLLTTTNEKPLRSYFKNDKDYKKYLKEATEHTPLNESVIKNLKPFATLSMIMQGQLKAERRESVDEFLFKYAQQKNMPTLGLETLEEQIAITDGIPGKDYLRFFEDFERSEADYEDLIKAYVNNDLEALHKEFKKDLYSEYWEEEFINKRNKIMFHRADSILQQNISMFIAVGAGHLGGPQGLINLFKENGYKVSPVLADKSYIDELLPSEKEKNTWNSYNWDLGYSIEMPGEIIKEVNKVPFVLGESLDMITHKSQPGDDDNLIYTISSMKIPKDYAPKKEDLKQIMKPLVESMISQMDGKLIKTSSVTSENYNGNEMEIEVYEGRATTFIRALHTDDTIFILQTVTLTENKENDSVYRFLNSLEIQ